MLSYLLVLHYVNAPSVCNISKSFNCEVTNKSTYGIFGIPLSAIGIDYFVVVLIFLKLGHGFLPYMFLLSALAVLPCIYLTYVQTHILGSIFLFCELTKVAIYSILMLSLINARKHKLIQFEF
jgi:uncharacterized membrane protein